MGDIIAQVPMVKKALSLALFIVVVTSVGYSQSARLAFDVISVKPNKSGSEGQTAGQRGSTFFANNATLRMLIQTAYRPAGGGLLSNDQILAGPNWMDTDHFDVLAKPSGDVGTLSPEQISSMVQSLLEDRFQLRARVETRDQPVYNLVIAKGGLKMKLSADQTPIRGGVRFDSSEDPLPRGFMRVSQSPSVVVIAGNAVPLSMWMPNIQFMSGRKVIDKTDLKGLFDFNVRVNASDTAATPTDESAASIVTALQELGLRLESAKAPLQVVVIDSVQKPSEN